MLHWTEDRRICTVEFVILVWSVHSVSFLRVSRHMSHFFIADFASCLKLKLLDCNVCGATCGALLTFFKIRKRAHTRYNAEMSPGLTFWPCICVYVCIYMKCVGVCFMSRYVCPPCTISHSTRTEISGRKGGGGRRRTSGRSGGKGTIKLILNDDKEGKTKPIITSDFFLLVRWVRHGWKFYKVRNTVLLLRFSTWKTGNLERETGKVRVHEREDEERWEMVEWVQIDHCNEKRKEGRGRQRRR